VNGVRVQGNEIFIEPLATPGLRARLLYHLLLSPGAIESRGRGKTIGPEVTIRVRFANKPSAVSALQRGEGA
jgi:hypothetical protein